jgi:nucleotide-binding universal stress UspA family protein
MPFSIDELEAVNNKRLHTYIAELKAKHGKDLSISSMLEMGFVFDEIENVVEKKKIDLLVMGITGAGKISELLLGSNATQVIKKLNCSTITVPEDAKFTAIKKIAFACDYNEIEESKAVDKLVDFVQLLHAKLMIVNIGNSHKQSYSKELSGRLLEYVFENVNETVDIPNTIDYSVHKRKDDDIVHGINHFVNNHKADLLVMIPRNHSFLSSLFHESNTKKMAFHSHVPLLTLHEEE